MPTTPEPDPQPDIEALKSAFHEYKPGEKTELVYRDGQGVRHQTEIPYDAHLDVAHPAVQEAATKILEYRKARAAAKRAGAKKRRLARRGLPSPQPEKGKWRAISNGQYSRKIRPRTSPEDRLYVPAALKHWRTIHGLSYKEAQARIGYSEKSTSFHHWESGFVVPPYGTLIRIIAATGLGKWLDPENRLGIDPALRLESDRARWAADMKRRKQKRDARDARKTPA